MKTRSECACGESFGYWGMKVQYSMGCSRIRLVHEEYGGDQEAILRRRRYFYLFTAGIP